MLYACAMVKDHLFSFFPLVFFFFSISYTYFFLRKNSVIFRKLNITQRTRIRMRVRM